MAEEKKVETVSTFGALDNLFRLFRLQGYVMPKKHKFLYCIYAFFVNFYVSFYMPFTFTVAIFKNQSKMVDLGAFFTTFQVIFDIYGGSAKIVYILIKLKTFYETDAMLQKLDIRCTEPEEIAEQKSLVRRGRKYTALAFIIYLLYAWVTCIGSVAIGRPPYGVWFPFMDWRNSRWEHYLVSFLEYLLIQVACVQQCINDFYSVLYVWILHSHLRILLMRIRKLGKDPNLSSKEHVRNLVLCIKDHKNLLDVHNAIQPVISVTIFIQFLCTAVGMGLTLINIMFLSKDISIRLGLLTFVLALVFECLPLCYFADQLSSESAKLNEEIFHSNWVEQSPEYRRILIFFMHRSQTLMEFDAGKLFPVTLNSFVSVIKFSFSMYTLLKTMY